MQVNIDLPRAFSVRDEHEFFPIQHLMARLNPQLMVRQIATGRHVSGGYTVCWGIVYANDQPPTMSDIQAALKEAGFDMAHNAPLARPDFVTGEPARQPQPVASR